MLGLLGFVPTAWRLVVTGAKLLVPGIAAGAVVDKVTGKSGSAVPVNQYNGPVYGPPETHAPAQLAGGVPGLGVVLQFLPVFLIVAVAWYFLKGKKGWGKR